MSHIKRSLDTLLTCYSWRQQLAGLVLIGCVVQGALVALVWRPAYQHIHTQKQSLHLIQQQFHQQARDIATWRQVHQRAVAMQTQLDRVSRVTPVDDAVTWFTEQAQSMGLVVEQVMWAGEGHGDNRSEIRFRVLGSYAQIGGFLNILSQYLYDLSWLELQWQAIHERDHTIRFSGRMHIVARGEEMEHD